jgi:hypothetical protein
MSKPTERELRHERIRAHAKAIFDGVLSRFVFRVSIPAEPDFPELEIPADNHVQARERYNAACSIRWTPHPHSCEVVEPPAMPEPIAQLKPVELMEAPPNEPQRRRRNRTAPPGGG